MSDQRNQIVRDCMSELRTLGVSEPLISVVMEVVSRKYIQFCEATVADNPEAFNDFPKPFFTPLENN